MYTSYSTYKYGAAYIRVSSAGQIEFSPDAQLKMILKYAKDHNIIIKKEHIYIDEGISGRKANKRPAFMKMIATAKSKEKPFDVILVHKFDRFARSREDSVVYKSLFKKESGVKVISITESIEDDKFSILIEAMLEAMAEYYSINLADEVKKGMTEKAERGQIQTKPSFGYKMENKQLVIIPDEAKIVKLIFNKFAHKEMGMRDLAVYINSLGIKTHEGNPFESRSIDYIINNPVYIGKVRWTPTGRIRRNFNSPDSIIRDSEHEPIIGVELWNKTQEVIKENKEIYRKNERCSTVPRSWLRGLLRCANCGCTLIVQSEKYMQCNGYVKGRCTKSNMIKKDVIEGLVLEKLKEAYKGEIELNIVPKRTDEDTRNEKELIENQLSKLNYRELRIKEAYQDGIDTLEEYKANKLSLKKEKSDLEEKLKSLNTELVGQGDENINKRIKSVYDLLINPDVDIINKYNASHLLIEEIKFSRKDKILTIVYK